MRLFIMKKDSHFSLLALEERAIFGHRFTLESIN